jgi:tetratricopeptide (TPR) repeat protein
LAGGQIERGEYHGASVLLGQALDVQRRLLPKGHVDIAASLSGLGCCHVRQDEYRKALPLHEEAVAMNLLPKDELQIEDELRMARSLANLASCYAHLGEYGKAVPVLERALALLWRLLPEGHPLIAACLDNLASCYKSTCPRILRTLTRWFALLNEVLSLCPKVRGIHQRRIRQGKAAAPRGAGDATAESAEGSPDDRRVSVQPGQLAPEPTRVWQGGVVARVRAGDDAAVAAGGPP